MQLNDMLKVEKTNQIQSTFNNFFLKIYPQDTPPPCIPLRAEKTLGYPIHSIIPC